MPLPNVLLIKIYSNLNVLRKKKTKNPEFQSLRVFFVR